MTDSKSMRVLLAAILSLAILTIPANSMAAKNGDDENFTHHRASMTGALTSSDCYQLQLSYHYMFWKYFGVGGSVGNWQNYFETGYASGPGWEIDDDDNKPWNLYLRPSVVVKSPALRIKNVYLSLYAEPGIMLSIPYTRVSIEKIYNMQVVDYDHASTSRGQWLAFDIHLGINADIGPAGISIGYLMSNLDIYSQFRHLRYDGVSFSEFYPKESFMQGAYLTLSYNF